MDLKDILIKMIGTLMYEKAELAAENLVLVASVRELAAQLEAEKSKRRNHKDGRHDQ